jgi:hypothetical protein
MDIISDHFGGYACGGFRVRRTTATATGHSRDTHRRNQGVKGKDFQTKALFPILNELDHDFEFSSSELSSRQPE